MSDENMAADILKAINSGGYVIVPERAVDGAGRSAIYVYYTENPQTGYSAWKISGGLNGGILNLLEHVNNFLTFVLNASPRPTKAEKELLNKFLSGIGKVLSLLGFTLGVVDIIKDCINNGGPDSFHKFAELFVNVAIYLAATVATILILSAFGPISGIFIGYALKALFDWINEDMIGSSCKD